MQHSNISDDYSLPNKITINDNSQLLQSNQDISDSFSFPECSLLELIIRFMKLQEERVYVINNNIFLQLYYKLIL